MHVSFDDPGALRHACRTRRVHAARPPAIAPGHIQANLMIVPQADAFDFLLFCQRNPKPCPLVEVLAPGAREPLCAPGADIATDLPGYRVYRDGELVEERADIAALWRARLRHLPDRLQLLVRGGADRGRHPAAPRRRSSATSRCTAPTIACAPAGRFSGEMVVSMRPIKSRDVARVVEICGALPAGARRAGACRQPAARSASRTSSGPTTATRSRSWTTRCRCSGRCGVTPQWVAQRRPAAAVHHARARQDVRRGHAQRLSEARGRTTSADSRATAVRPNDAEDSRASPLRRGNVVGGRTIPCPPPPAVVAAPYDRRMSRPTSS